MWRWSYRGCTIYCKLNVFSTYVEVIPTVVLISSPHLRILHVCGGDPISILFPLFVNVYSPRMWRWSWSGLLSNSATVVFSTYVEVILKLPAIADDIPGILHVCGGDPQVACHCGWYPRYSPRMWRWSLIGLVAESTTGVFSTYVEVILTWKSFRYSKARILHVCGGDPSANYSLASDLKYSPRMWRWSPNSYTWNLRILVFSTYVEVIL